nr:hypothetical protein MarFTME_343 [Marseillevirus futianmevirus]
MEARIGWYKSYFERNHKGKDIDEYVSKIALGSLVCKHKKELSRDKRVCEIFMAMMSDCLPLSRRFIVSWLEENGVEFLCECGEKAFSNFE